jgi:type IV secretion system protein VirD4
VNKRSFARAIGAGNHAVASASACDMLNRPAQERGSVHSSAQSYVSLYRDPIIAHNTNRSDFRIRDLMHYTDPVSLYLITAANDQARLPTLDPDHVQHDPSTAGR